MFSFEPLDRCLYNGAESEYYNDYVEQRFVLHFGDNKLDNRFFVVLGRENVRFFYYDYEQSNHQEFLIVDNLKEVGCISLTSPKDTGNDILAFPQMECIEIENYLDVKIVSPVLKLFSKLFYNFPYLQNYNDSAQEKDKNIYCLKVVVKCCLLSFVFEIEDRNEKFAVSPLYDHVRQQLRRSDVYKLLSAKIQYTLYLPQDAFAYNSNEYTYKARKFADCLMDEGINKIISPNNYPSKEKITEKLLSWFYNPEEELEAILERNRSQERGKLSVLQNRLVLKIRNFLYKKHAVYQANTSYDGRQSWFYNPEEELEAILERNRSQESGNLPVLQNQLVLKTRDFLYKKHAVYQANTSYDGKIMFLGGQILMAIVSISILVSFLSPLRFDYLFVLLSSICLLYSCFKICRNENISSRNKMRISYIGCGMLIFLSIIFMLLKILIPSDIMLFCEIGLQDTLKIFTLFFTVIAIFIFICTSGHYNNAKTKEKGGISYALFPRILVAELAVWLTIGIAEDFVKSMLWVDEQMNFFIASLIVFCLIGVIIFREVKIHSPYVGWCINLTQRVLPTINHSLFFGLSFGLVAQLLFYDNLIKNSDVMSSVVFKNYFDNGNYYCQNLMDLDKLIGHYHTLYYTSFLLKNLSLNGEGVGTQITHTKDTVLKIRMTTSLNQESEQNVSSEKDESHRRLIQRMKVIANDFCALKHDTNLSNDTNLLKDDSLWVQIKSIDSLSENYKDLDKNIKKISTLPIHLQEEIISVRKSIKKYNNYDTLMKWTTASKDYKFHNNSGSRYLDCLTKNNISNKDNKCSRLFICGKRIFPMLLIFHTLIVLFIVFVTQLVFSDKSITERL